MDAFQAEKRAWIQSYQNKLGSVTISQNFIHPLVRSYNRWQANWAEGTDSLVALFFGDTLFRGTGKACSSFQTRLVPPTRKKGHPLGSSSTPAALCTRRIVPLFIERASITRGDIGSCSSRRHICFTSATKDRLEWRNG